MKKIKTLICILFSFCFLCGCSTSVDFMVYSDGIYIYNELSFTFSESMVNLVEKTAAIDKINGKGNWTVDNYLKGFVSKYTSFEFDTVLKDNRKLVYSFINTKDNNGETPILLEKREVSKGFFFADIVETFTNPYTEYYKAFEEARKNPKDHNSMFGALLNGDRVYATESNPGSDYIQDESGRYYKEVYPSIFTAFPSLKTESFSDIATNFIMLAPKRTKTNGTTVYDSNNTNKFYSYSTSFSDDGAKIILKRVRMNPIGWFTIAGIIGGLTVLILVLVVRNNNKKKNAPKPTDVKDLFPYDPFS